MSGWTIYGYAHGDPCQRSTTEPHLLAALWRWWMWRTGGVRWETLRLSRAAQEARR